MGIGIRNLSAGGELEAEATNFAAALRQTAAGLLGTTVQMADLVRARQFRTGARDAPLTHDARA